MHSDAVFTGTGLNLIDVQWNELRTPRWLLRAILSSACYGASAATKGWYIVTIIRLHARSHAANVAGPHAPTTWRVLWRSFARFTRLASIAVVFHCDTSAWRIRKQVCQAQVKYSCTKSVEPKSFHRFKDAVVTAIICAVVTAKNAHVCGCYRNECASTPLRHVFLSFSTSSHW